MEYSDVDLGTWKPRNLLGVFLIDLTGNLSQLKEVNSLPLSFLALNGHSVDDFYQ